MHARFSIQPNDRIPNVQSFPGKIMINSALKVLMVNNLYAPRQVGGAEKSTQVLCEALAASGHTVHLLTLNDGPVAICRDLNGVAVRELPIRNQHWPFSEERKPAFKRLLWHVADIRNRAYDAAFDELADDLRPNIVHTHNLAGFSIRIWELARRRRIPVVHTLRDYYLSCPTSTRYKQGHNCTLTCIGCRPFEAARRRASLNIGAVVGISRFILDDHINRGFFAHTSIKAVIGNTATVKPFARRDRRLRGTACTFGFLGMLTPSKGVEQLLAAFIAVARPDTSLLIGGTGEMGYVESLRAQYQHPGIRFLGFVDSEAVYKEADIMVVPSLWNEPFSRVAMEAALHGIPIIASARGGLAEIAAQAGGTLFDPDQPESLAGAMRRALSGDAMILSKAHSNADVGSTFDTAQRANDYVSIYRRAAACS